MDLLINFVKISTYLYYQNLLKLRMHPQHFTSVNQGTDANVGSALGRAASREGSSQAAKSSQGRSDEGYGDPAGKLVGGFVCSIVFKT